MNAPFKQRENIELFLKGCENYGLATQDLFQVNDLYEAKNLYMIVDNLYALGGLGMVSNKMSVTTIFGQKHFLNSNFISKKGIFYGNVPTEIDIGSYLKLNG